MKPMKLFLMLSISIALDPSEVANTIQVIKYLIDDYIQKEGV